MVFGLLDVPSPTFATDFPDMIERIEHTALVGEDVLGGSGHDEAGIGP